MGCGGGGGDHAGGRTAEDQETEVGALMWEICRGWVGSEVDGEEEGDGREEGIPGLLLFSFVRYGTGSFTAICLSCVIGRCQCHW